MRAMVVSSNDQLRYLTYRHPGTESSALESVSVALRLFRSRQIIVASTPLSSSITFDLRGRTFPSRVEGSGPSAKPRLCLQTLLHSFSQK
jgi:hypothetical protein